LQKDIFVPRLLVIDLLLSKHFGIDEFNYEWNCIFPESASQKQERYGTTVEWMTKLVETGILSRESALKEVVKSGLVCKDSTLGENPNTNPTQGTKQ